MDTTNRRRNLKWMKLQYGCFSLTLPIQGSVYIWKVYPISYLYSLQTMIVIHTSIIVEPIAYSGRIFGVIAYISLET